jgi:NADH-quinone oxidoreductase subunit J
MSTSALVFYAISALILGGGLLAVTSRKIFRSAIYLLSSLVGIAALYFWMQVEFIAAVQIAVYVGGIVVLIIFSIFLTHESGKEMAKPPLQRTIFAILAVLFGFASTYNLISEYGFQPSGKPFTPTVSDMGTQMLSPTEHGYLLPFEVVSFLLLAAMIGCIVIAMKPAEPKPEEKIEAPDEENQFPPAPGESVVVVTKANRQEEVSS